MKNKKNRYRAVVTAGVLWAAVFGAGPILKLLAAEETSEMEQEIMDGIVRVSDLVLPPLEEYEVPSMGMIVSPPESLIERMEQKKVAMFLNEAVLDDDSGIQYSYLSWNILTEEQWNAEIDLMEDDYSDWERSLEHIGIVGVYQAELTAEVRQARTTITEMEESGLFSDADAAAPKFEGASLGEFTMQDINGQTWTQEMFQDYEVTMVNIFTTWCSPCVAEIPELEELRRTMADQGVNVVGVVMDILDENGEINQESLEKAKLLAERTGAQYPFLIPDAAYMNGRLTGIEAFPETFFVDKNGNIVGETYSGSGSLEEWKAVVEKELANLKEGA